MQLSCGSTRSDSSPGRVTSLATPLRECVRKKEHQLMTYAKGQNRRVVSEKVTCPTCGKIMSIQNLQFRHVCKPPTPSPEKLNRMRSKATDTAILAHAARMDALRTPGGVPVGASAVVVEKISK